MTEPRDFSNFKPQVRFPRGWHKAKIVSADEIKELNGNDTLILCLKNKDFDQEFKISFDGPSWSDTRRRIAGESLYRLGKAALDKTRFAFKELEGRAVGFLIRPQWNNWDFDEISDFCTTERASAEAENYVEPKPTKKQLDGAREYQERKAASGMMPRSGGGGYAHGEDAPHPANDPGASPWEDEDGY